MRRTNRSQDCTAQVRIEDAASALRQDSVAPMSDTALRSVYQEYLRSSCHHCKRECKFSRRWTNESFVFWVKQRARCALRRSKFVEFRLPTKNYGSGLRVISIDYLVCVTSSVLVSKLDFYISSP